MRASKAKLNTVSQSMHSWRDWILRT